MTHLLENSLTTLAFGLPGHGEWIILLILGLLIFGRRLPEVGRSIGRSIVEFKKGIKGIEDDIEDESEKSAPRRQVEEEPRQRIADQPSTSPEIGQEDQQEAAVGSGESERRES